METIFNHNVTINELIILNILDPGRKIDDMIVYENSINDELRYADLCRLYCIRGDQQIAEAYFNKIKNHTLN